MNPFLTQSGRAGHVGRGYFFVGKIVPSSGRRGGFECRRFPVFRAAVSLEKVLSVQCSVGSERCFLFDRDPRRQNREIGSLWPPPKTNRTIHFSPKKQNSQEQAPLG
ncbi:MAG: hypothetical protein D6714_06645 [Bacteroidetes bacterium]|nr:MAG: hypothetical protein D6714_06645 [Bacteroidota bacterium]